MSSDEVQAADGRIFRMDRELIEVGAGWTPVADPRWMFTDAAGHEHRRTRDGYPSLAWVITGQDGCGDPECCGETWDVGEYRCRECAEVIEPGTHIPAGSTFIPGEVHLYIDDEPVTKTQWDTAVADLLEAV